MSREEVYYGNVVVMLKSRAIIADVQTPVSCMKVLKVLQIQFYCRLWFLNKIAMSGTESSALEELVGFGGFIELHMFKSEYSQEEYPRSCAKGEGD